MIRRWLGLLGYHWTLWTVSRRFRSRLTLALELRVANWLMLRLR